MKDSHVIGGFQQATCLLNGDNNQCVCFETDICWGEDKLRGGKWTRGFSVAEEVVLEAGMMLRKCKMIWENALRAYFLRLLVWLPVLHLFLNAAVTMEKTLAGKISTTHTHNMCDIGPFKLIWIEWSITDSFTSSLEIRLFSKSVKRRWIIGHCYIWNTPSDLNFFFFGVCLKVHFFHSAFCS